MSRRGRWVASGLAVTALAVAVLASDLPARWLILQDPFERVDAAVVLAGDPSYERTGEAAGLVRSGRARLIVVTGGEPGPGDSAESLRDKAIALGVPAERIRMEVVSHGTREAMVAVAVILRDEHVESVALVTSPYHQRRTYLAARKALPGVRLVNHPVKGSFWDHRSWWQTRRSRRIVFTEYAKLVYYVLRGWI